MSTLKVATITKLDGGSEVTVSSPVTCSDLFTTRGIDDNQTSGGKTITIANTGATLAGTTAMATVTASGPTTLSGNLTCGEIVTLSGFTGDASANATAIQVDSSSNVVMTGTLNVNDAVDFDSTVNADSTVTAGGLVTANAGVTVNNTVGTFNAGVTATSVTASAQVIATPAAELTLASGAITITGTVHTVDTESDGDSTDDLDTINGGANAGAILVLSDAHDDRTVVAKDGTGNLLLANDFSMDHTSDRLVLIYDGTASKWVELSRSNNA